MHWTSLTALAGAAWLAVFAQAWLDGIRNFLGASIDLIPGLMVYAGLSHGLNTVIALSLLAGLLADSLSANPLGISILPLLLVGVMVYHYKDLLLREQTYAQFVLGVIGSAFAPILTVVLLTGMGQKPLLGWGSLWQLLAMALGGGCFTPLWFVIFRRLDHAFKYQTVSEPSFRADREIERGRR